MILAVILLVVHYTVAHLGLTSLLSLTPFYQPTEFDPRTLATATSRAALTYIGFDAVTTLAEEVENPPRTLARATVWVCVITGLVSMLIVYLGQIVWPAYQTFHDYDIAFLDVAQRIGGSGLFAAMVIVLLLANFGSALTGQAGAARLLFGMGRSGVFPRRLFAHLDGESLQPSYNVWLASFSEWRAGATLKILSALVSLFGFVVASVFGGVFRHPHAMSA